MLPKVKGGWGKMLTIKEQSLVSGIILKWNEPAQPQTRHERMRCIQMLMNHAGFHQAQVIEIAQSCISILAEMDEREAK